MKHDLLRSRGAPVLTWGLLILLLTAAGPATAGEDIPPDQIGTLRGDTLYVSLDKIKAAALAHNEMLAASQAMTDAARAEALGAWHGFLPQAQLGVFRIRTDDPLYNFGFKLNQRTVTMADFDPAYLNDPGVAENNIMQVKLLQPVFNGGMALSGKRAADSASRAAGYQQARAAEMVAFQAIQAYNGLALAQAYERVMLAAIASAEGHLRQAQALHAAEMATEADLLQARVYLSGLQQQLIQVRSMVAVAGENIKLLTAVRSPAPLAAAEQLEEDLSELPAVESALAGLTHRSDLLAHREQAEAAGRMVGVARGIMLPHLNLSAEKNYYSKDKLFGDDARSWTVGIYATWNVFGGLGNIGALKKARAEKRAAQYMLDFQQRQARVEANEAWLGARAARDKVAVAREAVEAARASLRIVSNQYREGLTSMVDLLDVQAAATLAEGNLVQALHDYNVGLARLAFASGATPAGKK
jgi:outer membrane protein